MNVIDRRENLAVYLHPEEQNYQRRLTELSWQNKQQYHNKAAHSQEMKLKFQQYITK